MPPLRPKGEEWNHVEIIKAGIAHNNPKVSCNYCALEFTGGLTRIAAHLTGASGYGVRPCAAAPDDVKVKVAANVGLKRAATSRRAEFAKLDAATATTGGNSSQSSSRTSTQTTLNQVFLPAIKEQVGSARH